MAVSAEQSGPEVVAAAQLFLAAEKEGQPGGVVVVVVEHVDGEVVGVVADVAVPEGEVAVVDREIFFLAVPSTDHPHPRPRLVDVE